MLQILYLQVALAIQDQLTKIEKLYVKLFVINYIKISRKRQ